MSIETDKLCQAIHRLIVQAENADGANDGDVLDAIMSLINEVEYDGADATEFVKKTLASYPFRSKGATAWYKRELINRESQYRSDKRKYG